MSERETGREGRGGGGGGGGRGVSFELSVSERFGNFSDCVNPSTT